MEGKYNETREEAKRAYHKTDILDKDDLQNSLPSPSSQVKRETC